MLKLPSLVLLMITKFFFSLLRMKETIANAHVDLFVLQRKFWPFENQYTAKFVRYRLIAWMHNEENNYVWMSLEKFSEGVLLLSCAGEAVCKNV